MRYCQPWEFACVPCSVLLGLYHLGRIDWPALLGMTQSLHPKSHCHTIHPSPRPPGKHRHSCQAWHFRDYLPVAEDKGQTSFLSKIKFFTTQDPFCLTLARLNPIPVFTLSSVLNSLSSALMIETAPFVEMCSLSKDQVELVMVCNPGTAQSHHREQVYLSRFIWFMFSLEIAIIAPKQVAVF